MCCVNVSKYFVPVSSQTIQYELPKWDHFLKIFMNVSVQLSTGISELSFKSLKPFTGRDVWWKLNKRSAETVGFWQGENKHVKWLVYDWWVGDLGESFT